MNDEMPCDDDDRVTVPSAHERITLPMSERETMPSDENLARVFDTAAEGFFVWGDLRSLAHDEEALAIAYATVVQDRRRRYGRVVMAVIASCITLLAIATTTQLG